MRRDEILQLLHAIADGRERPEGAFERLAQMPFAELGEVAKFDGHRALRNGFQETVLCEGKEPDHLVAIVRALREEGKTVLATRASSAAAEALRAIDPALDYDATSRTICVGQRRGEPMPGALAIVCAGTADLPVAEEARRTAAFFGIEARRHYDVGVAGIHRLFAGLDELRQADAVIVVAGMEGALPSVVGGLIAAPIVAVPTSVGYGASAGGVAALLGMLSSCAEGIAVVNIDNGFGAACAALRILRALKQHL